MGRSSDLPEDTTATLHVRRVPLDGDYDPSGTYWGGGGQPLFCTWDDEGRVDYRRADCLDDVRKVFPGATWAEETGPTDDDVSDMFDAYLTAMLFTSTDESDESGGQPLDDNYTTADVSDEAKGKLRVIVEAYARKHGATIAACVGKRGRHSRRECDWSLAGHCLWMAQAETGCGFTDGDWPDTEGKILDDAADELDRIDAYVGDDGKIYVE
jgi:hypothetical protein